MNTTHYPIDRCKQSYFHRSISLETTQALEYGLGMKTNETQIENLRIQIASARNIQRNADKMRDASGVFRMQRELETLFKQLDNLVPARMSRLSSALVHPAYHGR